MRNIKLFNFYKKDWTHREDHATKQLSQSIKRPAIKQAFVKNRVSVQNSNHIDKVREKREINEVIELLQDHDRVDQWQSNLRAYSSSQTKLN